jgi:hypothetical protein
MHRDILNNVYIYIYNVYIDTLYMKESAVFEYTMICFDSCMIQNHWVSKYCTPLSESLEFSYILFPVTLTHSSCSPNDM